MRNTTIAEVLFPGIRRRLLFEVFWHSPASIYATDLANRLQVRPSTLQRDLARLTAAEIFTMSRDGNRTYFQANQECPVYAELRALLLKTSVVKDVLHEALAPLAAKIKSAVVQASVPGEIGVSSPALDLLIIGSVKMAELSPSLERATLELRRPINLTLDTPGEFSQKARDLDLAQSILRPPLLFVIGNEEDLKQ